MSTVLLLVTFIIISKHTQAGESSPLYLSRSFDSHIRLKMANFSKDAVDGKILLSVFHRSKCARSKSFPPLAGHRTDVF